MSIVAVPNPVMRVSEPLKVRDRFERLDIDFPVYSLPGKHFKPDSGSFLDMVSSDSRTYCDITPAVNLNGVEIGATAVVFQIEARINARNCFLSSDGDQEHPLSDEEDRRTPFASCWLEAPDNSVEGRWNWRRALQQLQSLARHADSTVRMGEFLAPKDSVGTDPSPAMLQVYWKPPAPFDTLDLLPVFDANHQHIPIASHGELPVGKRVRVHFVVNLGLPIAQLGGPVVGAQFVFMHILD